MLKKMADDLGHIRSIFFDVFRIVIPLAFIGVCIYLAISMDNTNMTLRDFVDVLIRGVSVLERLTSILDKLL